MSSPFDPGYYTSDALRDAGFKRVGTNVRIARNCTIIGLQNIEIGNDVRIDGYCTIIAGDDHLVSIGSFVHIGGYSFISGGEGVRLDDFSGLSQGVRIYTRSDDYSGAHLTNPTVPALYTCPTKGAVTIGRHVIIGSGSIILPRVSIAEGAAIGALSLVNKSLAGWSIYTGRPARRLKERSRALLDLEAKLTGCALASTPSP